MLQLLSCPQVMSPCCRTPKRSQRSSKTRQQERSESTECRCSAARIRPSAAGRSIRQPNREGDPMSPSKRSDSNSEFSPIANDEVQKTFDTFIAALSAGDHQTLGELY